MFLWKNIFWGVIEQWNSNAFSFKWCEILFLLLYIWNLWMNEISFGQIWKRKHMLFNLKLENDFDINMIYLIINIVYENVMW
jgi:hypothetical protein